MDIQTVVLYAIGFLVTLVIWLIKDSQRKIEKRIDNYERKNEAEHAKFSEALAQHRMDLTALSVEVAKLTVPTEREILESIRRLAPTSGVQERKLPDGD